MIDQGEDEENVLQQINQTIGRAATVGRAVPKRDTPPYVPPQARAEREAKVVAYNRRQILESELRMDKTERQGKRMGKQKGFRDADDPSPNPRSRSGGIE